MFKVKANMIGGIGLCLILAIPAWFLGKAIPVIGGPVFGILIGMLLAFGRRKCSQQVDGFITPGIGYTAKYILQIAIIFLGFEMNLFNIIKVGGQSLAVMVFTLGSSFITAYLLGKALRIESKTTILIGVGTSICGGSAIAATAPVIRAEDEEVARAISTIFLFNVLAVFIFPPLGHMMGLSDTGFGMWAGTAINDTSSVVAAGAAWSNAAGNNTALAFATIVKLTRTLMIVPITLVLALYTTRKVRSQAAESGEDGSNYSIVKIFPWFVLGFVLMAVINTFGPISPEVSATLVEIGKFMIVMAMTAIGLNTDLIKLLRSGTRPICLGLSCWFVVAVVSIVVQKIIGIV